MYSTKFVPQQTRTELVQRNRLLEKLALCTTQQSILSLIVAPSGYGKSTLLAQAMSYCTNQQQHVCWLNLDEDDNDEDTFITYLIESYHRVINAHKTLPVEPEKNTYLNVNSQARLEKLLNQIENIKTPIKIILDDFQVLTNSELLNHIEWLLKRVPANLSFFIISRKAPELSIINELRAKNKLIEISANELNFTFSESKLFLQNAISTQLNDTEIQKLQEKTEGWVAATQLFSHAIPHNQHEAFIENISGTDKDIVKYLGCSVLNEQSKHVKEFLMNTSILGRFNAELCCELCDTPNAANMLEQANNQGLFILELDREKTWFRYHHLFKDFLLGELNRTSPNKYKTLANKAANWFEQKDYTEEAIDNYLLAEQFEKASELISEQAIGAVQHRGNHNVLLKWIDRLPTHYTLQVPTIAICYAWSLIFTRKFEQGDKILAALKKHQYTLPKNEKIIGYNIGMLSILSETLGGKFNDARISISQWFQQWPDAPAFEKGVMLGALGATCLHTLEFSLARKVLMQAKSIFETTQSNYGIAWMDSLYALIHFKQGHLLESKSILENSLIVANNKMGEHSFASSMLHLTLSQVYCDLNNISRANQHLKQGFNTIDIHGLIDTAQIGFIVKSRLQHRQNKKYDAIQTLSAGEKFGRNSKLVAFEVAVVAERIRLLLRSNNIKDANDLYTERGFDANVQENAQLSLAEVIQITAIQIRIALANKADKIALQHLTPLIKQCKQKDYIQLTEHLLLLNVTANYRLDKKNQAFRLLDQVIKTTAPENKLGLFIDEAYHLIPVITEFLEKKNQHTQLQYNDKENKFVANISKLLKLNKLLPSSADKNATDMTPPKEKLTKREKELLTLLKQGLSNKELAESMFVSESTIKWHLSRVYIKLGVKNRLAAIQIDSEPS